MDRSAREQTRILITGATGFIGSHLCDSMLEAGYSVRVIGRRSIHRSDPNLEEHVVDDLSDRDAVAPAFRDVDWVIHAAGLAHKDTNAGGDPLLEYRQANAATTRTLAEAAIGEGASAFVLISSAVVLDTQRPRSGPERLRREAYARSKAEGETVLLEILGNAGPRTIILRAPMVYGPGMRGNPLRLFRLVASGLPLPLSGIQNLRSSLYVQNLAAAVRFALENPDVSGTYQIDDGPLSTPEFISQCARALTTTPRLFYVPVRLLRSLGRLGDLVNRVVRFPLSSEAVESLTGSMVLDVRSGGMPGFEAPFTSAEGMQATARWFRNSPATRGPGYVPDRSSH